MFSTAPDGVSESDHLLTWPRNHRQPSELGVGGRFDIGRGVVGGVVPASPCQHQQGSRDVCGFGHEPAQSFDGVAANLAAHFGGCVRQNHAQGRQTLLDGVYDRFAVLGQCQQKRRVCSFVIDTAVWLDRQQGCLKRCPYKTPKKTEKLMGGYSL